MLWGFSIVWIIPLINCQNHLYIYPNVYYRPCCVAGGNCYMQQQLFFSIPPSFVDSLKMEAFFSVILDGYGHITIKVPLYLIR